jgi:hypothetical protein
MACEHIGSTDALRGQRGQGETRCGEELKSLAVLNDCKQCTVTETTSSMSAC